MGSQPPKPETPNEEQVSKAGSFPVAPVTAAIATTTGRRQAFRDIRRQLTEADLASPGVQKLILEELEKAESDCENLQGYVDRYHEADKQVAVLQEKSQTQRAVEIFFGVGVGISCAIIGSVPYYWDSTNARGPIALAIGAVLLIGSIVGRWVKR